MTAIRVGNQQPCFPCGVIIRCSHRRVQVPPEAAIRGTTMHASYVVHHAVCIPPNTQRLIPHPFDKFGGRFSRIDTDDHMQQVIVGIHWKCLCQTSACGAFVVTLVCVGEIVQCPSCYSRMYSFIYMIRISSSEHASVSSIQYIRSTTWTAWILIELQPKLVHCMTAVHTVACDSSIHK